MKKPITFVIILLLLWLVGVGFLADRYEAKQSTDTDLQLVDGSILVGYAPQNILFGLSSAVPELEDLQRSALQKIASYLKENPEKNLLLLGQYSSFENSPDQSESLGLARAKGIEELLLDLGAPMDQIHLSERQLRELPFLDGKTSNGITMASFTKKLEDIKEVKIPELPEADSDTLESILAKKLVFRFEPDNKFPGILKEQRKVLDQLAKHLNSHREQKLKITGHTDNIGPSRYNWKLGERRAKMLRDLLLDRGIKRVQIIIESKGETEPISDNETQEGRTLNRRVEVELL